MLANRFPDLWILSLDFGSLDFFVQVLEVHATTFPLPAIATWLSILRVLRALPVAKAIVCLTCLIYKTAPSTSGARGLGLILSIQYERCRAAPTAC